MIELRNEEERKSYIEALCLKHLKTPPIKVAFIDEGVMNYVYSVKTQKGIFYFKQAISKAKHADRIGADLASVPMNRTEGEVKVMRMLENILPAGVKVPRVIDYDKENNILMMSDVSEGGRLLQENLLDGNFDILVSSKIGEFLGTSHRETYGREIIVRNSLEEDRQNWLLFLNMRTRGISCEGLDKKVSEELERLYFSSLNNHTYNMLVNMDVCPKNIIQRKNHEVGILDMELSSGIGDPAYDVGFSLGHYFLFSTIKEFPKSSIISIKEQYESYLDSIKGIESNFGNLRERIIKYAGAVMIYRVSGSSPAKYIPKNKISELKSKSADILMLGTSGIKEAIKILKN